MPDTKASADPSVTPANVADADSLLGLFASATGTNGRLTFANLKAYLLAGLAVFSTTAKGLVPASGGGTTKYLRADGTFAVPPDSDTTYAVFKPSGTGSAEGLVPNPGTVAGATRYLREDGTWTAPPAGGGGSSGPKANFAATVPPTANDDASQGYEAGSPWQVAATGEMWRCRSAVVGAARWVKIDTADHPGYVAGRRYVPFGMGAPVAGVAGVIGTTFMGAGVIKSRCTLSELHIRMTTAGATGNYALAIYAHDPLKPGPTGLPLATSVNGATGTTGPMTVALNANVTLEPGIYWFAYQADQSSPIYLSQGSSSSNHLALFGSAGHPIGNGAASQASGFSINGTFGTWPDLTSASLTEQSSRAPYVGFTVASVP